MSARAVLALLAVGLGSGCGYAPANDALALGGPLAVVGGPVRVADAEAADALMAGARAELARAGALGRCDPRADPACPHVVVELLALDDESAGVVAPGGSPDALGLRVTAHGRAYVRPRAGPGEHGPERPAAETSASAVVAPPPPSAAAAPLALVARREAARRAARRLGEQLVRALLSVPEPTSP